MMKAEPRDEHRWLARLVGEWDGEGEADMAPGQPVERWRGTESVRTLGGLWTLAEGRGEMPGGGGESVSLMTLGYDPEKGRFVGTFVASMMTWMWVYEGSLDERRRVLTLNTVGPDFGAPGKVASYRDVIEFVDDDRRTLTSFVQSPDGQWRNVMRATYRRRR